jgi:hypothetical protein
MNGILKNIAGTFSHAVDYAKEKITAITGKTSVTIAELSEHIINQPETFFFLSFTKRRRYVLFGIEKLTGSPVGRSSA